MFRAAAEVVSDNSPRVFAVLFLLAFSTLWFLGSRLFQEELHAFSNLSILPFKTAVQTQSRFTYSIFEEKSKIPYEVQYQKDPNLIFGETQILKTGKEGIQVKKIRSTFYEEKFYAKEIIATETVPPEAKIILFGTKKVPGKIETPHGTLSYSAKLRVFATSYDKNCRGCNETTASGMKTGYGVIAVDPSFIPLSSRVYIPGYGIGIAGDVGGAIKGAKVDLGFDDVRYGFWSARDTDLYILQ